MVEYFNNIELFVVTHLSQLCQKCRVVFSHFRHSQRLFVTNMLPLFFNIYKQTYFIQVGPPYDRYKWGEKKHLYMALYMDKWRYFTLLVGVIFLNIGFGAHLVDIHHIFFSIEISHSCR